MARVPHAVESLVLIALALGGPGPRPSLPASGRAAAPSVGRVEFHPGPQPAGEVRASGKPVVNRALCWPGLPLGPGTRLPQVRTAAQVAT